LCKGVVVELGPSKTAGRKGGGIKIKTVHNGIKKTNGILRGKADMSPIGERLETIKRTREEGFKSGLDLGILVGL